MTDQPSSATPHTPGPTSAPRPWWRRGSTPYLLGLVVLLPATLATPWWVDHRANLADGFATPRAAQVDGDTADLAGSTWTFLGMATEEAYPGTQTVDAAFTVHPGNRLAADRLYYHCGLRAVDSEGRTWEDRTRPEDNPELPYPDEMADLFVGCRHPDHNTTGHLPVDTESLVVVHFVIPSERVDDVRFEVEVATNDPEVDYNQSDEEWEEEVMESVDNPEKDNDNPPRPQAVSFPSGTELDYAELDRYTFDVE